MRALWRTAARSKGGIAAERDGFYLLFSCSLRERNLVNLVDYCRLRRDFRVRGWVNLVDFSKVSLRSAMVMFECKKRLNIPYTVYSCIKDRRFALCKSLVLSKNGKEKRPAFGWECF